MDWDYDKKELLLSMPGYIEKALKRFGYERPKMRQDQPHEHLSPTLWIKTAICEEGRPPLGKEDQQFISQVLGTFLFNVHGVDNTLITLLSAIASEQATRLQR